MQTYSEPRIFASEPNRFGRGLLVHHQARRSQNALSISGDDGVIDGSRSSEIIGIDDQASDHEGVGVFAVMIKVEITLALTPRSSPVGYCRPNNSRAFRQPCS